MQANLNRKQSTVYFSDIVGYTRLMGKDENAAFELMKENLLIHQEILEQFQGKIIKELGDGILAVFATATDALNASLMIQTRCKTNGRYQLRIGLQSGEIIFDHGDIFGDAVNIASRIQSVGIPGSILFSERIYKEIANDQGFQSVKLGGFDLKNVDHTLELYTLANPPLAVPKRSDLLGNIKYQESNPWKFRIGIAAIVILLGALIYSVFWGDTTWKKDKSVAVLPFASLSENSELDYFTDGLTENIIDQLSKVNSIKTISYQTMAGFKNLNPPLDSIAGTLKVSTILKGTVEQLNQGYRFKLQLIDVKENKNIWTDEYTREGTDLIKLQNEIAREIARILDARLTAEEATQIGKGETTNVEAYDLRLQGRQFYQTYKYDDLFVAVNLFIKAIELDKNYALAHSDLAKSYAQLSSGTYDSLMELSLSASSKSLALEPKLAEGYGAQGLANYYLGKVAFAKNSFELALNNNPNQSEALGNIGIVYFARGDLRESLKYQYTSSDRRPDHYLPYQIIGWICRIMGKNDEGLEWLSKSLTIKNDLNTKELIATSLIKGGRTSEAAGYINDVLKDSIENYPSSLKSAGTISLYLNKLDEAKFYFEKSMDSVPDHQSDPFYIVPISLAYIYKKSGDASRVLTLLDPSIRIRKEAIQDGLDDYNIFLDLATAYWIKGNKKEAFYYLNEAYLNGWRDTFFVENNPIFSDAKSEPEYKRIVGLLNGYLVDLNREELEITSLHREK